jgi:general stress protein YciG
VTAAGKANVEPGVSAYLARIGSRGGQAKGSPKRRSVEHYRAAGRKGALARYGNRAVAK